MYAAHLPDDLWRSLIDDLDAGVLILDADRVVVYANAAAADLLDYPARDVLGLDGEDFLALCQPMRLDFERLQAELTGNLLPASQVYAVMTARRRISVRVLPVPVKRGVEIALILRPLSHWRAELITRHTLNELHRPLAYASDYADSLLQYLEPRYIEDSELRDMVRVSHASLRQVMDVWEALRRLDLTGAWALPASAFGSIRLEDALSAARQELVSQTGVEFPVLEIDQPDQLPAIRGAPQLLHVGLCALLEGAAARLRKRTEISVKVGHYHSYVEVAVAAGMLGSVLHPYLFDELPFAIVEQAVLQHGGRIWFDNDSSAPACCFSLPVWKPDS